MTEANRYQRRWSRRRLRAGRGQSLTELALLTPLLAAFLLGIVELAGAYSVKMDLQAATTQAARVGALEGTTTSVDQDVVNAVISAHGLNAARIRQIQVFRAAPDGSIDNGAVNTYVPPFTGTTLISTTYNWPPSARQPNEPSDAIGVHVTYAYNPMAPLFNRTTIMFDDQTVQHLTPTQGAIPCPIPGIPTNVTAAVNGAINPPNPNDVITWDPDPSVRVYKIYADVNGAGWNTTPIYTGTGSIAGSQLDYIYTGNTTYAPTAYEVTGSNDCGEGKRSLPADDGQCTLPVTPTILDAWVQPGGDYLDWTDIPFAASYSLTQTVGISAPVVMTITAPITNATMPYTGTPPPSYTVSATTTCGEVSPHSAPVTPTCPVPDAPSIDGVAVDTPAALDDTVSWTPASTGGPASTWVISQTIGSSVVTQTVTTTTATFTVASETQSAQYTVRGSGGCGDAGAASAPINNGRS